MILLTRHWSTITPESAEEGEIAESGTDYTDTPHTFRELVDLMSQHPYASEWPASGSTFEWLSTGYSISDYSTAEEIQYSLHFSRNNPPRKAKYWAKAMKTAGIIKPR